MDVGYVAICIYV